MLDFSRAKPAEYAAVMRKFSTFVWDACKSCYIQMIARCTECGVDEYRKAPADTRDTVSEVPPPTQNQSAGVELQYTAATAMGATPTVAQGMGGPNGQGSGTSSSSTRPDLVDFSGLPANFDEFDFPASVLPGPVATPVGLQQLPYDTGFAGGEGWSAAAEGSLYVEGTAAEVDPYSTGFAGPLGPGLVMRLGELGAAARAAKIEDLKLMSAEGIERENNSASNFYTLNTLGLGEAEKETLWGGAVPPKPKQKTATQGKRGGKRKATPGDSDEGGEGSEEEPQAGTKRGTKAKAAKATVAGDEWAKTAKAFLSNKEFGTQWTVLLAAWWAREESFDFVGTVSIGLCTYSINLTRITYSVSRIAQRRGRKRLGTG